MVLGGMRVVPDRSALCRTVGFGAGGMRKFRVAPEAAAPQSAQETTGHAAANCPGRPDTLGTSRVLAIDPTQYPRIGHMQYPDSVPLNDKEVVLTFDDGPLLPYSNQILDILASQCVARRSRSLTYNRSFPIAVLALPGALPRKREMADRIKSC